jgi:hypothetical protein
MYKLCASPSYTLFLYFSKIFLFLKEEYNLASSLVTVNTHYYYLVKNQVIAVLGSNMLVT